MNLNRLSKGNYKLPKSTGIFNLPAGSTCPNCKDCYDTCYARQAEIQYAAVRNFRAENERLARNELIELTKLIKKQIKRQNIKIVRIHESGDFFSDDYMVAWAGIAADCHDVKFYGYTKEKKALALNNMENMNIIYSYVQGKRNYGSREYVLDLKQKYGTYICPAKGCLTECTHCLTEDSVAFEIHGNLKRKDTYEKEAY
jgi:hypothetical protein